MKLNIFKTGLYAAMGLALAVSSCQKMDRPELKEILLDPEPPAYNPLKSLWSFENNITDEGENGLKGTVVNTSYVAGAKGQALKFGAGGYWVSDGRDTTVFPNEYSSLSYDSLSNLGSLTVSFWMNGTGPVVEAQGLFSIAHKSEFWGHFDVFLESNQAGMAPDDAYFKVHIVNDGVSADKEQWIDAGAASQLTGVFGKWTHIAFVYDAATSSFTTYRDGAPTGVANRILHGGTYGRLKFNNVGGIVWGTHQFMTTPSLTSNHGAEGWARSFNGAIDQARIYNKALSAAEINQLFTSKD
ncbi:MAG: LamG domain-containing protein [Chitinophagaceae bacterium]|nr:MAG: LamG domain-containing protein [Chitinophagaceae bacterium]